MPKPFLWPETAALESDLVATLLAGLKEWRPDLAYPESHSDMQACVRAALRMFDIKRLPLPRALRLKCEQCKGTGYRHLDTTGSCVESKKCLRCDGRAWVPDDTIDG